MQKKVITIALLGMFVFAAWAPVGVAQETDSDSLSVVEQIEQLLQQVRELQSQLASLEKQQQEVKADLRETIQLTRSLYRGLSGEDVRELQEILAADSSIYPEGIVTGYFGPLTEQAVRRFQARFGIASIGIVGPQTIARIQAQLDGEDTIHRSLLNKKPINKDNPSGICRAQLDEDPAGFVEEWGTNRGHGNAFGRCVSATANQLGVGEDEDAEEEEIEDADNDEDEEDAEEDDDDDGEDDDDSDDNSGSGSN